MPTARSTITAVRWAIHCLPERWFFLKESDVESVIPGGMYVVVTRKIVTLRQLHLEAGAQSVRLTASCEAGFDEMVVKSKDIQKIYRVKAHLIVD